MNKYKKCYESLLIGFVHFIPSLVVMSFIFIASNDSSSGEKSNLITSLIFNILSFISPRNLSSFDIDIVNFAIRKIAHISEYFVLMLSNFYFFSNVLKNQKIRVILLYSFLFTLSYSTLDEFHQSFIPTRVGTYKDVLIDSIGILLAYLTIFEYKNFKNLNGIY